jgi:hypothetical protein
MLPLPQRYDELAFHLLDSVLSLCILTLFLSILGSYSVNRLQLWIKRSSAYAQFYQNVTLIIMGLPTV